MTMARCGKASVKKGKPSENSREWAEKYIQDIHYGRIVACKWVRKAINRHIKDLKGLKGYYFDPDAGEIALKAFTQYKHYKGKWAGKNFIMLPWQQAITYIIFGWKNKKTGFRRFRTAYIEVARKNGKSEWAAGTGLYMLDMDGEAAAEVYSAATMRGQAKIVHTAAKQMVKSSPHLRKYIKVYKDSLAVEDTVSIFEPLSADYNSLDGLNVSCAIIDELHAHRTRDLYDVLDTATGAREQPLIVAITTAGVARESICREMHDYVENILNEVIKDETVFGIIFTLDDDDDWTDEDVWIKANPSLGETIDIEEMRERCNKAKNSSASKNAFLRLRMNVWTSSSEGWIDLETWLASAGKVDIKALKGRQCYLGADLSSVNDISAICAVFPDDDGTVQAIWKYYLPEDDIEERARRDRVPYEEWAKEGYITLTPGNVIDYDYIEEEIKLMAKEYKVIELATDPYNATQLTNHLIAEKIPCVDMRQGFLSMSPPTKAIQRAICAGEFHHGDNPVTTWMLTNCEVVTDPAGNVKLDKAAKVKRRKIDGLIAAIMAYSRYIGQQGEEESVYTQRGIITL